MSTERADAPRRERKDPEKDPTTATERPRGSDRRGGTAEPERRRDIVTEASEESFPASDPPAWTGTITGAPPD